MRYARYAIYYTAAPGRFAQAGATWLGWDIETGAGSESPAPELTARPRKYGFHGTVKPPFSLAAGQSYDALHAATASLCASATPVILDGLEISAIGSFLAFVPMGDQQELAVLASRAVRELDAFRAPPSEAELARRRQAKLTPAQEEHLLRWGYPYVMDSFRFHMTLSGPVARAEINAAMARAQAHFATCALVPYPIDSLTLAGEREDGFFEQIERFPLSG